MPVVHVICATLRDDAAPEAVAHAVELARALPAAEGATHTIVGRTASAPAPSPFTGEGGGAGTRGTDRQLVAVTWLDGRDALEPFAASPAHMAFIMRGLAPCIAGMWSAAVESEAGPPSDAAALWVFALPDAAALFEWQVRDLLADVAALPGRAAAGVTVEERERYRAGGAVCLDAAALAAFPAALAAARAAWSDVTLVDALVEVVRAE